MPQGRAPIYAILLAAVVAVVTGAHAAPIVSESFDYPMNASLVGANGGDGFTNAWSSAGSPFATTGLDHPALFNESGQAATTASNVTTGIKRTIDTSLFPTSLTNGGATFGTTSASGTLWISYLHNISHAYSYFEFESVRVGINSAGSNNYRVITRTGGGSYTITPGQTNLIIIRIIFNANGNDDFALWVNPASTSTLAIGDAVAHFTDTNFSPFNQIQFANIADGAAGNGGSAAFDELRLSTELADVIPEPASLALLMLLGAASFLPRRRPISAVSSSTRIHPDIVNL